MAHYTARSNLVGVISGNKSEKDLPMKQNLVIIASLVLAFYGGFSTSSAEGPSDLRPHPFGKRKHVVLKMNGEREPASLPAEIVWISEPWYRKQADENAQMPYLTYLPEKDRVVMLVITHHPTHTAFIFSDDHGKTWSERSWLKKDEQNRPLPGIAVGLTNLGKGNLQVHLDNVSHGRWLSSDYGETWKFSPAPASEIKRYVWDPLLVLKDSKGNVRKLLEGSYRPTGVAWGSSDGYYSQGYFRESTDLGETWSSELKVPQWLGVNEINLMQAANGDLVAACRTDYPKRFAHYKLDHFGGLAVSISQNEGKTWSALNPLYEFGRHHPSMVLMPNGDIVMSYVVRLGYPATHTGYPQFGVEAVVSHDNGQTWDKAHRYILANWVGNITGSTTWFCSVQSTSTILMPDGTLLTAFGTGFRNPSGSKICKMDVALVRWRLAARKDTNSK